MNLELAGQMASDMRAGLAPKGSGIALLVFMKPDPARRAWGRAGELIEALVAEVEQARCVGPVAGVSRPLAETVQASVDEVEALRLMSYTGSQPDMSNADVDELRALLGDLTVLLCHATGTPIPEAEVQF